jgi:hypothetical protein
MNRLGLFFAVGLMVLGLVGCGDDSGPDPDQGQTTDQGVSYPDGAVVDQGETGDQGASVSDFGTDIPCGQIALCADACTAQCPDGIEKFGCMINCNTDCKALGCAAAQPLFDAVTDCVQAKCIIECAGGPTPGCKTCTETKCATETNTCNAHTC